jgi:hypothetical protein
MRQRSLRLVGCLVLAGAALAGCGGDNEAGDETTTTDSGAGDAFGPPGKEDELAGSVVLRLSDFPRGWTEGEMPEDEGQSDDFKGCPELEQEAAEVEKSGTGTAASAQFSLPDTATVDSEATVFENEEAATRSLALFERPEVADCISSAAEQGPRQGAEDGYEYGQPVTRREPALAVGDDAVAYRVTLPVTVESGSFTFLMDIVAVRAGRLVAYVISTGEDEPLDANLQQQLARAVANRMKAA